MYTLLGLFIVMIMTGTIEYILISNAIIEGILFTVVEGIMMCTSVLMYLVLVITFVWYLLWVFNTSQGLRALNDERMFYGAGSAISWYFIPLMNLYKPYLVMKEIWLVSHRHISSDYKWVKCWWAMCIASSFVSYFLTLDLPNGDTWAEYLQLLKIYSFIFFIYSILLVVSIMMIKKIAVACILKFGEQSMEVEVQ